MTRPRICHTLAFAHIGDLHITSADAPNYADFLAILAQIETELSPLLDFVVLPGDCADNGRMDQYRLIEPPLRMLSVPVHAIPGDHDMEAGGLCNFYAGLKLDPLPRSMSLKGHRCLFLDFCGAGSGGLDFRLGGEQLRWLEVNLASARDAGETPVLFMHSYPADLRGNGEVDAVNRLIAEYGVALVDIGHTHYNELANDGETIFAATRSTGQREEGPVGYSIATIDRGVVSWRFKLLEASCPFVMITTPADRRLVRGQQRAFPGCVVGALVFGAEPATQVEYRIDDGPWLPMERDGSDRGWHGVLVGEARGAVTVSVRAFTAEGRPGMHTVCAAGSGFRPVPRPANGSDDASIGAWPENDIFGTQLGPNRNGRKW